MKKYIKPSIDISLFKNEDILTASTISVGEWSENYDSGNVIHVDYNNLSTVPNGTFFGN
ncbi:MAG: hypothetical protein IJT23_03360 [Clostridia bacterium]|nr:hypothetical protein [Clostridia bacterium]